MSEILRLRIKNFDNLENHASLALQIHDELFCSDENGTAHKKISDYLKQQNLKLYLGHDQNVYPSFEIDRIYLR